MTSVYGTIFGDVYGSAFDAPVKKPVGSLVRRKGGQIMRDKHGRFLRAARSGKCKCCGGCCQYGGCAFDFPSLSDASDFNILSGDLFSTDSCGNFMIDRAARDYSRPAEFEMVTSPDSKTHLRVTATLYQTGCGGWAAYDAHVEYTEDAPFCPPGTYDVPPSYPITYESHCWTVTARFDGSYADGKPDFTFTIGPPLTNFPADNSSTLPPGLLSAIAYPFYNAEYDPYGLGFPVPPNFPQPPIVGPGGYLPPKRYVTYPHQTLEGNCAGVLINGGFEYINYCPTLTHNYTDRYQWGLRFKCQDTSCASGDVSSIADFSDTQPSDVGDSGTPPGSTVGSASSTPSSTASSGGSTSTPSTPSSTSSTGGSTGGGSTGPGGGSTGTPTPTPTPTSTSTSSDSSSSHDHSSSSSSDPPATACCSSRGCCYDVNSTVSIDRWDLTTSIYRPSDPDCEGEVRYTSAFAVVQIGPSSVGCGSWCVAVQVTTVDPSEYDEAQTSYQRWVIAAGATSNDWAYAFAGSYATAEEAVAGTCAAISGNDLVSFGETDGATVTVNCKHYSEVFNNTCNIQDGVPTRQEGEISLSVHGGCCTSQEPCVPCGGG